MIMLHLMLGPMDISFPIVNGYATIVVHVLNVEERWKKSQINERICMMVFWFTLNHAMIAKH